MWDYILTLGSLITLLNSYSFNFSFYQKCFHKFCINTMIQLVIFVLICKKYYLKFFFSLPYWLLGFFPCNFSSKTDKKMHYSGHEPFYILCFNSKMTLSMSWDCFLQSLNHEGGHDTHFLPLSSRKTPAAAHQAR